MAMLLLQKRTKAKACKVLIHIQVVIKQLESKHIAQRNLGPIAFSLYPHIKQMTKISVIVITGDTTYFLRQLFLKQIIIRNTL